MSIDDTIGRLRTFARTYNLSQAKFAKKAELHPSTLNGFYEDGWSPTVNTIRALEKARKEYLEALERLER